MEIIQGGKTLKKDINGEIKNKATFNGKRRLYCGKSYRLNFSHNLISLYEGKNISYFVEKPYDDNLLYFGKNEELEMIKDSDLLLPFVLSLKILMEDLIRRFIIQKMMIKVIL